MSETEFWSLTPRELAALVDRWLEDRHLSDAMSAKAPYAVARALGEANFADFLILTKHQEPQPSANFKALATALQSIAPK